ncbi:MAG: zinc finger domain-containing protein, partial [Planctomycetota bacterium]|nr:zinc finger domain-containing protein [Planctomycetota bacterium]
GVGNIYADESLFEAGVNPALHAARLTDEQRRRLVEALSRTLARAVAARGSTLRDYTDGHGQPGAAQLEHRVYGRSGERCTTCRTPLRSSQLAQRTTVWCPTCQP